MGPWRGTPGTRLPGSLHGGLVQGLRDRQGSLALLGLSPVLSAQLLPAVGEPGALVLHVGCLGLDVPPGRPGSRFCFPLKPRPSWALAFLAVTQRASPNSGVPLLSSHRRDSAESQPQVGTVIKILSHSFASPDSSVLESGPEQSISR